MTVMLMMMTVMVIECYEVIE